MSKPRSFIVDIGVTTINRLSYTNILVSSLSSFQRREEIIIYTSVLHVPLNTRITARIPRHLKVTSLLLEPFSSVLSSCKQSCSIRVESVRALNLRASGRTHTNFYKAPEEITTLSTYKVSIHDTFICVSVLTVHENCRVDWKLARLAQSYLPDLWSADQLIDIQVTKSRRLMPSLPSEIPNFQVIPIRSLIALFSSLSSLLSSLPQMQPVTIIREMIFSFSDSPEELIPLVWWRCSLFVKFIFEMLVSTW